MQQHEQRAIVLLCQCKQSTVQLGIDIQQQMLPAISHGSGAWTVVRKAQLIGQVGQRLSPIAKLARMQAGGIGGLAQQLALPQGVVGVLQRQRCPGGLLARHACGVGMGQVVGQRDQRGTVAGNVMQKQQQDVLFFIDTEQRGAQRQFAAEIEGVHHCRVQCKRQLRRLHLDHGKFQYGLVQHLLAGRIASGDNGAQAFVPLEHVPQRRLQRGNLQWALQLRGERNVVGGAGALELMHEPQAALRIGQWQLRRPRPCCLQGRARRLCLAQSWCQRCDGARFEDVANRDVRVQARANLRNQAQCQQRMPAELEEVVVDAHTLQAKHLGKQLGQYRFFRRAWCPLRHRLERRRRQRLAVELAVGVQRQGIQRHEGGGNHVVGQALRQLRA
ncbi:hypothetical protein GCM10007863_33880 [Dyella mobilis]|nr:hypothetical protein GCM10007863_33880 [Dyella mobilis]